MKNRKILAGTVSICGGLAVGEDEVAVSGNKVEEEDDKDEVEGRW